jgi:hypothetical protein
MHRDRPWEALIVCRPKRSDNPKPEKEWLRPFTGEHRQEAARHLLQVALDLRIRALREPLPLFDQSSEELFTTGQFDERSFDTDLLDQFNKLLWERYAPDEVLALPIRDDDIAGLAAISGAGDVNRRAAALATTLWRAFAAFVQSGSTTSSDDEDES